MAWKAEIVALIAGRVMLATKTAWSEFEFGVNDLAGPTEKQAATALLPQINQVADDPSARFLAIPYTQAFGINDRTIFGTGDRLGIPTLTANTRALRYI